MAALAPTGVFSSMKVEVPSISTQELTSVLYRSFVLSLVSCSICVELPAIPSKVRGVVQFTALPMAYRVGRSGMGSFKPCQCSDLPP